METESEISPTIEKTLKEQIIEKMIGILKESENFTVGLLRNLEVSDLKNKNEIKEIISIEFEEEANEDTQAGN